MHRSHLTLSPATFSALAIGAAVFLGSAWHYAPGDGDLWWQRQLGEAVLRSHTLPVTLGPATFSAPGAHWLPHEWVFATLWALALRAGAEPAFAVGCTILALVTLMTAAARTRDAAARARLLMLVLVTIALTATFGLRANVLGWPLLGLLMLALEGGPRRAWFAVPIAIVWCNVHASGLVVPCIVILDGVGRAIDSRRWATLVSASVIALACGAASLATPFGIALPEFTIAWSSNPATQLIDEWLPAAPDKIRVLIGVYLLAALLAAGELRGARLCWRQRLLALALFAATLLHIRNLSLFAIVAGPWAAYSLTALLPLQRATCNQRWRTDGGPAALAALGALLLFVARIREPVMPAAPARAVTQLVTLHRSLRVACEDFSWCSRFAAESRIRVLLDGRTDAYPKAVFDDYRRLVHGDALPVIQRWQLDAAIVHPNRAFARALQHAGWKPLFKSTDTQVYLRPQLPVARKEMRPAVTTGALQLRKESV